MLVKDEEYYNEDDYRIIEKNHRAKRVVLQALSEGDKRKILGYDTAFEIWEALKRLYSGNEDIQRNRILTALKEYESITQAKNESLEDFHSRFQTCVGQLVFLGERMEDWRITHRFLQALDPSWDNIAMALHAQSDIKAITLEELVARLQSHASVFKGKKESRESTKSKSLALKVEKAFELVQTDAQDDDDLDESTALITRALRMTKLDAMRKFRRINKGDNQNAQTPNQNTQPTGPKDKKDIICWWCQKKGHISAECLRKKAGKPATERDGKAMLAAWGDEGEESDCDLPVNREVCLMALGDETNDEVNTISPSKMSRTDLLKLLKDLTIVSEEMTSIVEEQKAEIAGLTEDNKLWSNTAMELQDAIKKKTVKCNNCPDLKDEIKRLEDKIQRLETEKTELVDELERKCLEKTELTTRLDKLRQKTSTGSATDDQETPTLKDRFRPGLGYVAEEKHILPTDSGRTCVSQTIPKNQSNDQYVPFDGSKAYQMWKKQAENPKPLDLHARKKVKPYRPGKSKYVNLRSNRVCWHCGNNGHYRIDCNKLKADRKRNEQYTRGHSQGVRGNQDWKEPMRSQVPSRDHQYSPHHYQRRPQHWTRQRQSTPKVTKVTGGKPRETPRRKVDLGTDWKPKPTNKFANAVSYKSKMIKPKLIWVRKTDVSLAGEVEETKVVHRQCMLTPHDGEQGVVPDTK